MSEEVDYGPLSELIGTWKGNKGLDVAPEPDGTEKNPYHETMTFEAIGEAKNAEVQVLSVLRYHQVVQRQSNDEIFHDQVGYWMWDASSNTVMQSLTIPRAVCVLAGGVYDDKRTDKGEVLIEVAAKLGSEWNIIQSPFMKDKAKTTSFSHKITVGNGKMSYLETTMLDIYGKVFEHTDENELTRQ